VTAVGSSGDDSGLGAASVLGQLGDGEGDLTDRLDDIEAWKTYDDARRAANATERKRCGGKRFSHLPSRVRYKKFKTS